MKENRRQQERNEVLTREELRLTREGQVTERFTRAIEQLGNDNEQLDVTLGGIYALARIAKDSPPDRATIAEILTAYVRGHAPWRPEEIKLSPSNTPLDRVRQAAADKLTRLQERRPDVQAALKILGGMGSGQHDRLELQMTDLRKADLVGADLEKANFGFAHLEEANLAIANLKKANLIGVHLVGANLSGACLEESYLIGGRLQGANLRGARLSGARLLRADLEKAKANAKTEWPDDFDWKAARVVMEDNDVPPAAT